MLRASSNAPSCSSTFRGVILPSSTAAPTGAYGYGSFPGFSLSLVGLFLVKASRPAEYSQSRAKYNK